MSFLKTTIGGGLLTGMLIITGGSVWSDDRDDYPRVPRGHMPRQGECRIWYPGKAPGHQLPPGNCRTLSREVPRGAWLVAHDRRWKYDELRRRDFRHDVFDHPNYSRREIQRQEVQDVRQARKQVQEDKADLQDARKESRKDRAELRKDLSQGASKQEIVQDQRELRDDRKKVVEAKRDLRQSQENLRRERQDLR